MNFMITQYAACLLPLILFTSAYLIICFFNRKHQKENSTGQLFIWPDPFGYFLSRINHGNSAPILSVVIWIIFSSSFCIGLPILSNSTKYFSTSVGVITSITYTFLVPLLVGSYVSLINSFQKFTNNFCYTENNNKLRFYLNYINKYNIFNYIIYFSSIFILYFATKSAEKHVEPGAPWTTNQALDYYGGLYYFLRGLDTSMALGLVVLTLSISLHFLILYKCSDPIALLNKNYQPSAQLSELTISIILSLLFGTMIISLHGVSLFLTAVADEDDTALVDIFISSTWIIWVLLTTVAFILLFSVILAFRKDLLQARYSVGVLLRHRPNALPPDLIAESAINTEDISRMDIEATEKVNAFLRIVPTWPITGFGAGSAFVAVLLQGVNIVGGIAALLSSK